MAGSNGMGYLLCVFLTVLPSVFSLPYFMNGRPRGGMVGVPVLSERPHTEPQEQWISQRLDHYNDADLRTWQQRYYIDDSHYIAGGPVFLNIGGEGPLNSKWLMAETTWIQYAMKYGALCLLVEHRYYGKSHPTVDVSTDSLQYLSSEQALADLAYFRNYIGEKLNITNNKWIAFGGNLAAWFRIKYPHLVDGAVATSAPVLAKLNFTEYLEVVRDSLASSKAGEACNKNIQAAVIDMQKKLQTTEGEKLLQNIFQVCGPINSTELKDVQNFHSLVSGNFEGVVQYNRDNREFEGAVGTNITLDTLCDIMVDESIGDPLHRYAAVNTLMLQTYQTKCLDISYDNMIQEMRQNSWNSSAAEGGKQWVYQTCTEFGYYQTSDAINQPFGHNFPLSFSLQQCQDIYGKQFNQTTLTAGIKSTNTNYGGLGLKTNNVVFPNGSIDPWHALGITQDVSQSVTAIYIKGTAHCANMYPEKADDLPQLKQARKTIEILIGKWIQ
uniref:Serine protease K12H4.7-like n=1 Tax=Saccoglossus kowalevskii TaxID=10224 RepID=A0ABM0MVC0_SACKO|nr:PREDICTED: putative serine protease K12H4.7-like [Saccoglossus kowalevskii]